MCPFITYCVTEYEAYFTNFVLTDNSAKLKIPAKYMCFTVLNLIQMKKVNKQCILDTPRTVRVSEKTWQVIAQTRIP